MAQATIDSREFAEWVAFYSIEPFGETRADLRSAIIASTIANANSPKSKRFTVADFIPKFHRSQRQQSGAEMQAMFKQALGRRIKKK